MLDAVRAFPRKKKHEMTSSGSYDGVAACAKTQTAKNDKARELSLRVRVPLCRKQYQDDDDIDGDDILHSSIWRTSSVISVHTSRSKMQSIALIKPRTSN